MKRSRYSTKGQTVLQSWCGHRGPPAQLYFWAISNTMKVTVRQGGSLPVVLAFEWKSWLRPWAEQPAVFPSEDSTVSQLRYLTCSPDLSGFLFCFYTVNNLASWVSGDSYSPKCCQTRCWCFNVWASVVNQGALGNLWGFLKDTAPREFLGTEPKTHQFPDRLDHTGIHPHTLVFLGF